MRFIENGPDIPSHLLEQQARGNVIFFCGAGVSIPAGLPDFKELTKYVTTALRAEKAGKLFNDGAELDNVFRQLVNDFGRSEIDREIYNALGTRRAKTLAPHRAIMSLSKGATGTIQIVTTNYDLLFERAGRKTPAIIPPNLPNLELNQSINGIVYLHGRLTDPNSRQSAKYVISSADFGRAYLAEGWAARFVKELRERYTLVFLGYRAEDPPMRYLLEGLNDREGIVYSHPIYAFAADTDEIVVEAWHDRGVTPIKYDPSNGHASLWNTIYAWEKASDDPRRWAESVINLARKGPRNLRAFERGQVVELVSTKKGAAAFADAKPTITSEWLCVFDPDTRFGEPRKKLSAEDAEDFDPQDIYGLDTDPPRPPRSSHRLYEEGVQNPLAWRSGDGDQSSYLTLQASFHVDRLPLPARLHSLARWFGAICHEPAAVWWASGQHSLNQHLLGFVAQRLRNRQGEALPDQAVDFWSHYLEHAESQAFGDHEHRWFEFEQMIKGVGWNSHSLRYLERCIQPTVAANRPSLSSPCPPAGDWADINFHHVTYLEVSVLNRYGHDIDIPKEILPTVVRLLRVSLIRMIELLEEVGNTFWRAPNLHPSDKPGESYYGKKEQLVLWFSDLFSELTKQDATLARDEWKNWPKNDERLFDKLRVWVASLSGILSDKEAHALLLSLSDQAFWSLDDQRGILLLIKQRWHGFSAQMRRSLERRIGAGPPRSAHQSNAEYKLRKASRAASRLRWLELNGCALSSLAQKSLGRLKKVDGRWSDEWAECADDSFGPRGGMITEVTDTQGLEHLSIAEILDEADRLTKENFDELRHDRPFKGLVKFYPFKALSSLRRALKDGKFPVEYWIDLLLSWPNEISLRLRLLLAHTITNLSDEQALELRYYSTGWLQANLGILYRLIPAKALALFDGFLRPFLTAPPELTKSSIGKTTVAGEVQVTSEVSYSKAINSPVGKLAQALWSLTPKKSAKRGRLAPKLSTRFARLAEVPADGAGHGMAILTEQLGWIAYCYEDWSKDFILPKFSLDHRLSEAAWHGFAWNRNWLPREVWEQLRAPLLNVVRGNMSWHLEREARHSLINAIVRLADPKLDGGPVFSFGEIQSVLKDVDDQCRGHALWSLRNVLGKKGSWSDFVKPFILQAWPREMRFRSEVTTRAFLEITEDSGDDFADVVRTVKSLLRPVPHGGTFTYRLSRDELVGSSNAKKYPLEAIQLLNAITGDDRVTAPYGLANALKVLAELEPKVREAPEFRRLEALVE